METTSKYLDSIYKSVKVLISTRTFSDCKWILKLLIWERFTNKGGKNPGSFQRLKKMDVSLQRNFLTKSLKLSEQVTAKKKKKGNCTILKCSSFANPPLVDIGLFLKSHCMAVRGKERWTD